MVRTVREKEQTKAMNAESVVRKSPKNALMSEFRNHLKPGEGAFECRECGQIIVGKYRTKGLWDGRTVKEYYCPVCRKMKQSYL